MMKTMLILFLFSGTLVMFHAEAEENLALNRKVAASSIQYLGVDAHWACDGKSRTRWASRFSDPQWLMVDLASVKTVGRVVILWENSAALDYKIQLSSDGENWIDAIHKTDGKGGEETLSFSPQPARFVRFTGQFRIQQYGGYSFREFQVFEK